MISHPDAEAVFASLQTPEMKRGMGRVPLPQVEVLRGETLNFRWQRPEELPEPPGGDGFHSGVGHSRRRPSADSLPPSSKRKLSLPAEASASICSSHRPCSRKRNHCTMRRYSSGGKPSIAASISSIRLIPEVYHHRTLTLPDCQTATRRPRCLANGSKSRSLCSRSYPLSMHRVAITVSMVLRTVTPSLRSARKFFPA